MALVPTGMVSTAARVIFIHQRKVAGTALIESFGLSLSQDEWHLLNDGVLDPAWDRVRDEYPDFLIVSAVRNPFDRAISGWRYLPALRSLPLADALRNPPAEGHDFRHFTRTQSATLVDRGGRLVPDVLLRYETLQQDYAALCQRIGRTAAVLPVVNASERRRDYRSYYDDESRALAEALFREDINRFGYQF
jgi:hypothetical protein